MNGPVWDESQLISNNVFPTILAIGDSWFWYPKNNLAIPLHKILNKQKSHVILVRGYSGAEAVQYASGVLRSQLEKDLDRATGYGRTLQAVFVSGGGNDLAGTDDFPELLRADCSSAASREECLRDGQPARLFDTVTNALLSVVALVQEKLPGTPVFVHGYDYACPNGKGFLGQGQWLQLPMDQCSVDRTLQQDLVNLLIDRFHAALTTAQAGNPALQVVNQRGTLGREDWANELHPTVEGFNRLAKCWVKPLVALGLA